MSPITDTQVSELPLERGRTELLEAIMSTPVLAPDTATQQAPKPRRPWRTGLAVGAAAAAVAAIVAAPLVLDRDDREPTPAQESAPVAGAPEGDVVPLLKSIPVGWKLLHQDTKPIASVTIERLVSTAEGPGALDFSVEIKPASEYDSTVEGQATQGGRKNGTIQIDGRNGTVWTLTEKGGSARGPCTVATQCVRHWTAISPVEDGQFVLVSGSGLIGGTMSEAEFRKLVKEVRIVVDP